MLTVGFTGMGLDLTPVALVKAPHAPHLSPGAAVTIALWFNPRAASLGPEAMVRASFFPVSAPIPPRGY